MPKTSLSDPITLRMPVDLLASLEEIAELTERKRSWLLVRAVRFYLQQEGADLLAFKKGKEQLANGEYEDFDGVMRDLELIAAGEVA